MFCSYCEETYHLEDKCAVKARHVKLLNKALKASRARTIASLNASGWGLKALVKNSRGLSLVIGSGGFKYLRIIASLRSESGTQPRDESIVRWFAKLNWFYFETQNIKSLRLSQVIVDSESKVVYDLNTNLISSGEEISLTDDLTDPISEIPEQYTRIDVERLIQICVQTGLLSTLVIK